MSFRTRGRSRAAIIITALAVAVSTLSAAPPAGALAPTSTSPAHGSTVTPPATIEATYDARLVEAQSTIAVTNGNNVTIGGSTTVDNGLASGTIVFTPASTLTEAGNPYRVTVHAKSLLDTHDHFFDFSVDTTVPAEPTIASVTNPVNAANQTTVVVSGEAEAGGTVRVTIDDQADESTAPVSASVASDGTYEATLNVSPLDDGPLDVTATARDQAGNLSSSAATQTTKDATIPAAPTVTIVDDPIDATNQGLVEISGGSGEENLEIDVSVDDEVGSPSVVAPATTGPDGSWMVVVDLSSLVEGEITATATATDAAENVSEEGLDTATKELGPPNLLSTTPAGDSSVPTAPEVTAAYNEPLGTAASTITVTDNTSVAAAGTKSFRDNDQTIAFTPSAPLPEAGSPYTVTLAVKDVNGNAEDPPTVFSFNLDATAPAPPVITGATDPINAANQAILTVEGEAEAGATVEVSVTDEASDVVTDTVQAAEGTWAMNLDVSGLMDGTLTVTATASDAAGNTSGTSVAATITKDTQAPVAPTITSATDPVDPPNEATFEVAGDAEPASSVDVTVTDDADNTVTGSTVAADNGTWALTLDVTALEDGTLTVTAMSTDAVGNTSGTSVPVEVAKREVIIFDSQRQHVSGDYIPLAGDFNGDGRDDIFWYGPGTGADHLWLATTNGNFTSRRQRVSGDYIPLAGDFNGDGRDDVFWYGPGTNPDHLWLATANATFSSHRKTVQGRYFPAAGDFDGDGFDDIFWVKPGTGTDHVWFGSTNGRFRSASVQDNGRYFPIVGDFNGDGLDDLLRYGPGTAPDSLVVRPHGTIEITVNGFYTNAPTGDFDGNGRDDVFWYRAGSGADHLWLSV